MQNKVFKSNQDHSFYRDAANCGFLFGSLYDGISEEFNAE